MVKIKSINRTSEKTYEEHSLNNTRQTLQDDIENNQIYITAEDIETAASAKEKIKCVQSSEEKITIAFNGDYLKEILEKSKTEETKLVFKDELSAALILPKEQGSSNKISLLMPIRLN